MATARELMGGRTGLRKGLFGTHSARTMWHVTVDAQGDDPCQVVMDSYVPMGTPHPHAPEVVAIEWVNAEQHSHTEFFVEVNYGPPILLPSNQWTITLDTALDNQFVEFSRVRDANGNIISDANGPIELPIGPRVYLTHDEAYEAVLDAEGNPTGTTRIKEGVDQNRTFFAKVPGEGNVPLYVFSDIFARRVIGLERRRRVGQITFEIVVSQVPQKAFPAAWGFATDVNRSEWYGFPSRTVQFVGPQVAVRYNVGVEGQPDTGVVFDIRLPFLLDMDGHQPLKMLETFKTESGDEVPVFQNPDSRKNFTDYWPYGESNFDNLLAIFAPPSVIRGTGRTWK